MARFAPFSGAGIIQRLALCLVIAAFAARGLVPAGYMVDQGADGGLIVRICGGATPEFAKFDPLTGETGPVDSDNRHDKDPQSRGDRACPFALTAILFTPSSASDAATRPFAPPLRLAAPQSPKVRAASEDTPPPARAPPFRA